MSLNRAPRNNVFYRDQNRHYPKLSHGKGIYLYDESGKDYIDGCSGSAVANIGHGSEEVAKHAQRQIKTLAFSHLSRFTTEPIEECARRVASLTPGDLNHCYFVSGGSEATETCIKMARQYYVERDGESSKHKVISRWTSFHGNTLGALSMTGIAERRKPYEPMLLDFPKINQAYCYRCPHHSEYPACGLACAHELEKEMLKQGPQDVLAFIAEPVVGSAAPGIHPPAQYFAVIRDTCTKYDVLFIADEVMSGFGRTGKAFGMEHYGVVPDIMAVAKGMSAGYSPLGAAVANDEIHETIMVNGSGRFVHGHTYGGNPLSASIANRVIEITLREKYTENAEVQGEYLMQKLQGLYEYSFVGDIRGKGLMIGVEFVRDRETREPFEASRDVRGKVTVNCLEAGVVVYPGGGSADGVRGDHILLAPPLCITGDEVDELFRRLDAGIRKTAEEL